MYVHTYVHTQIYICIYVFVCTYIYLYVHVYMYVHTYINTQICTYIYIYIHTYSYTYMYTHTDIYTHTHTCLYMYVFVFVFVSFFRVPSRPQHKIRPHPCTGDKDAQDAFSSSSLSADSPIHEMELFVSQAYSPLFIGLLCRKRLFKIWFPVPVSLRHRGND